jgi:hypothetical protein
MSGTAWTRTKEREVPALLDSIEAEVDERAQKRGLDFFGDPEAGTDFDGEAEFRTPPFLRYRDKVAIVGFTQHRDKALELDDSWEIWGLNELYRYMPADRFHRWFEIHDRPYLEETEDGVQHMADLPKALHGVPIYMQKHHEDIPTSIRFPVERLVEQLDSDYWTNCPAYMIGVAIAMGYEEIAIYGVDMAQETEYAYQRPCCEHWLGVATGMGIKTSVPPESDLLKTLGLYAYDGAGSILVLKLRDRRKYLETMMADRQKILKKLAAEYERKKLGLTGQFERARGAIGELGLQEASEKRDERIVELKAEAESLSRTLGELESEYREKREKLVGEINRVMGGIEDINYLSTRLLPKLPGEGQSGMPDRSADELVGVQSGDHTDGETDG